ncbi:MAG TPA: sugar ABC transporter substrate-binding protein [Candidatus Eisenbacteria bacterium]
MLAAGASCAPRPRGGEAVRFWAMGREGEVVQDLVRDFERENPGIRVEVQQIPWSAAHEKLLTGYVGGSTPDVAQLGNTWISEFVALRALEPLGTRVAASRAVPESSYYAGIWDTNVIDALPYGIPWYVDTRVLFYRRDLLARAGYASVPTTWAGWRAAMEAVERHAGRDQYAILLPLNEWPPLMILGLQAGSPLLDAATARAEFSGPQFRRAFDFYLDLFHRGLAPPVSNTQVANVYQEFGRGTFAMYITGPWNLGEFRNRLPAGLQDAWSTAPLPGPDGPGLSMAGGSSLVVFRGSRRKDAAWRLVEFLSRPEVQVRFYHLTGDLPARREAWADPALAGDARARAFEDQLRRVAPWPKIPEWEQITSLLQDQSERAVRGAAPGDSALTALDRDVDRVLEKRRWLLARARAGAGAPGAAR